MRSCPDPRCGVILPQPEDSAIRLRFGARRTTGRQTHSRVWRRGNKSTRHRSRPLAPRRRHRPAIGAAILVEPRRVICVCRVPKPAAGTPTLIRTGKRRSAMVIISRGLPGICVFHFRSNRRSHHRMTSPALGLAASLGLSLDHVWPRPSFLRCQRDQACVLDPAASADSQLPAELECGADRLAPRRPLLH